MIARRTRDTGRSCSAVIVGPCCVLLAAAGSALAAVAPETSPNTPPAQRGTLRERMLAQQPQFCFVADPTPEEMAQIMAHWRGQPPGAVLEQGSLQPRFFNATGSNAAWDMTQSDGLTSASQAKSVALTYSFPDDTPVWRTTTSGSQLNVLNATLTNRFGAANIDQGRELIRQGLASWRRWCGISYTEVTDNNTALSTSAVRNAARGDIRIGCVALGTTGVLAYNYYPSGGGDMTLNQSYFTGTSSLGSTGNDFRYLRNVISHEHGHGLGLAHPTPCAHTKLMEPLINTNFDAAQIDDIRGGQRNYGDRYAGNNSVAAAKNYGDLTSPAVRSVIERNLSTNGSGGPSGTGADWFRFTLSSAQNITITVTPTGGNYQNLIQPSPTTAVPEPPICGYGSEPFVNASQAGNLGVELLDGTGTTVIASSIIEAAGVAETVNFAGLAAGTYSVRVFDSGPNDTANQVLQLYDMTIRVGASKAPPVAIAGIHKRVQAGLVSYFFGNLHSYTTDTDPTGGANTITVYSWDLDGDGVFETAGSKPTRIYLSNGTYPVTLRVTDENALTATDTINVVVFGASTSIAALTPSTASLGSGPTPITITGVNFKGVTSASQVTFSGNGGGVTVSGTPVVNALGTQITGLSITVAPEAILGARDLVINNADGLNSATSSGTKIAALVIDSVPGACCAAGGTCTSTTAALCAGAFQGAGSLCFPSPCVVPTGSCCALDGACSLTTQAECGGAWASGGACDPNPCPQPMGACCSGSTCASTTQAACSGGNTAWAGAGSVCNAFANSTTPCCKADFNHAGGVTIDDIFSYLNAWFSGSPTADFDGNGAGTPAIDDIFQFLNAWFAGC